MSTSVRVSGDVLLWFKSYIIGRSQSIYLPTGSSVKRAVWCGVPQGSVLSLILLALYAAENLHRTTKVSARRGLQSTDNLSLTISSTRLSTLGDRAIPVVASQAWNSLPNSLRNIESLQGFYRELKTSLFSSSFDWIVTDTVDTHVNPLTAVSSRVHPIPHKFQNFVETFCPLFIFVPLVKQINYIKFEELWTISMWSTDDLNYQLTAENG